MSLPEDRSHLEQVRAQLELAASELNALLGVGGVGDGPNAGQTALSQLPLHVHYKIFRDYIEHEDGLIDKRLLWNINIQGFLFATYGFSVQKLAEVQAVAKHAEIVGAKTLYWLIFILPIFGAAISYYSLEGVLAAQDAISQLKNDWLEKAKKEHPYPQPSLPGIIGWGFEAAADHEDAHTKGFKAPRMFPQLFIAAWAALFMSFSVWWIIYFFKFGLTT
jgi:hypothetical protein